ncbi:MAG: hypothetical protein ACJA1A_001897 [Saprospiraceae bacterium]|jgi:hypothetical protein|tara:strand:+ start:350 stop:460 length:111 start_codon:yes stop_codon:yes gene_type:complete
MCEDREIKESGGIGHSAMSNSKENEFNIGTFHSDNY